VADSIHSIHILGSREFGGADQFYVRLLRALKQAGQTVTAINRPKSPVANALDKDAIEQIHLPLANRWDAWSAWQIRRRISEREPCVVQTYMGRATRLTRTPKKSKAVHIARLGGFYKIDGYYRHADAWVGNTQAICDFLVKSGMPAKSVHHIGNFVPEPIQIDDLRKKALREEHHIPESAWVIFALGRLIEKKGFQDLFRAMARLPKEINGKPAVLLLAGDGPDRQELQLLAKELEIEERVRMLGWQDPPDAFYSLADIFVCPSRHEPLGNVILEAWNHLVPVVSTRSDGALELIEDGVTGLLCDYEDDEAMAALICQMLEASAAARTAMATTAKACLLSRYDQKIIVGRYLSLYKELMSEKLGI
jgi:glycosyltransferase involved in cell wall biosynthesis